MFFAAIPPAIEAASLATKITAVAITAAVIFFVGLYAGSRWEQANTTKVQADFDKFVSDSALATEKQNGKSALKDQRFILEKRISDDENDRARDSLVFFAGELQRLSEKSSRASVMPKPPTDPESAGLTCFDGTELVAADERYRAGEAERRARIHRIVEEGAKDTADLNTAKRWKQGIAITERQSE